MKTLLPTLALLVLSMLAPVSDAVSSSPEKKTVCNEDGTKCKTVTVRKGHANSHPSHQNARYTDHKALENACRKVWTDDRPEGLGTCQQRSDDSGSIDVLGSCGNSVHNGIETQKDGKCGFNLQLSCRKRDGSWHDTQASCKSLLNAPDNLKNDDGSVSS